MENIIFRDIPLNMYYKKYILDIVNQNIFTPENRREMRKGVKCCNKHENYIDTKYGNISNWNVSKITNMHFMFKDCYNFNQDVGDWDVSSVVNMRWMFGMCYQLNQDLSSWNVMYNADIYCTFYNTIKMEIIPSWYRPND